MFLEGQSQFITQEFFKRYGISYSLGRVTIFCATIRRQDVADLVLHPKISNHNTWESIRQTIDNFPFTTSYICTFIYV